MLASPGAIEYEVPHLPAIDCRKAWQAGFSGQVQLWIGRRYLVPHKSK
jgi:hypothetical protein